MSMNQTEMWADLIRDCRALQEPCIPDPVEPWFSVRFVAVVLGYDSVEGFVRKLTAFGIPRHPIQAKCIRFSDLATMHERPERKPSTGMRGRPRKHATTGGHRHE